MQAQQNGLPLAPTLGERGNATRARRRAGRAVSAGLLGTLCVTPVRIMVVVLALVLLPTLICYQLLIGLVDQHERGDADID